MEQSREEIRRNITLTHFILQEGKKHPEATGQMSVLLHSIEIAAKYVSSKVRAAGLFRLYGADGSTNTSGDTVKKLDVIANEAFITSLSRSRSIQIMVSEENEGPIAVKERHGHYCAMFDPLDGSSNIDANVSIGSIFGIHRILGEESDEPSAADVLQAGSKMVASGYVMYGSATVFVLTTGQGVHGFTLDPSSGEFVLTHPSIQMPERRKIYSINRGNSKFWYTPTKKYIESLENPSEGSPYSQRYVGSMVADVHRTLLYGGIFAYPADKRAKDGKLRLLYEVAPMSMLIEKAGGKATTGTQRILDIVPTDIHQRVGIYCGSRGEVEDLEKFFEGWSVDQEE